MQKELKKYLQSTAFKDFIIQSESTISLMALPHQNEEKIHNSLLEMGRLYNHFIIGVSKSVIAQLEKNAPNESEEVLKKSLAVFLVELEELALIQYTEAFAFFLGYRNKTKQ